MRVLAISGSLRAGSYNAALARAAARVAPAGVEVEILDGLGALPHYDADLEGEDIDAVESLRERIDEAGALFVVTPEYNGSLPGALKNAIDWASRPKGDAALQGKTVAIAGASTGQYGALWAIQDLRRVLGIAGARVIEGEVSVPRAHTLVDETGELRSSVIESRLESLLAALGDEAVPEPIAAYETPRGRTVRSRYGPSRRTPALDLVEALPAHPERTARRNVRAPYAG